MTGLQFLEEQLGIILRPVGSVLHRRVGDAGRTDKCPAAFGQKCHADTILRRSVDDVAAVTGVTPDDLGGANHGQVQADWMGVGVFIMILSPHLFGVRLRSVQNDVQIFVCKQAGRD